MESDLVRRAGLRGLLITYPPEAPRPVPVLTGWALPETPSTYVDIVAAALGLVITSREPLRFNVLSRRGLDDLSHGAITQPEMADTARAGLFSQRIFGPVRDLACACGKYKGKKFHGLTCEVCGVDLCSPTVRSRRIAHIAFARPVVPPHLLPLVEEALGERASELLASVPNDGGVALGAALDSAPAPALRRALASPSDALWTKLLVVPPGLRAPGHPLNVALLGVFAVASQVAFVEQHGGFVGSLYEELVRAVDRAFEATFDELAVALQAPGGTFMDPAPGGSPRSP